MKNELSIDHVGYLEDLHEIPKYVLGNVVHDHEKRGYSCCFCGVGDSGFVQTDIKPMANERVTSGAKGSLIVKIASKEQKFSVFIGDDLSLKLMCDDVVFEDGALLTGNLSLDGTTKVVRGKAERFEKLNENSGIHHIDLLQSGGSNNETKIIQSTPTKGCMKLTLSMMRQKTAYPIHVRPSYLDVTTGKRVAISYADAIDRFADMLLRHRGKLGRTLMYACGQIDYFSIFASQEVFRLLGVRNLTGNAEHCLNAGAVHNEMLTGQEGPFLTLDQSVKGENRLFLMNGWNGHITHPPAFRSIIKREKLDAYIIEVMVSESAIEIAKRLDAKNVLLIKPASDPHLALAVAQQIFVNYPDAIKQAFISKFSDLG
ncbi:MAG: hypothetical protein ACJA2O_001251, partial [Candidatus Azotimanducaceae bacterium]